MPKDPVFFKDAIELVVGFMKRATKRPGITWPEAVDEALCVSWIDGVRHRIDDERYRIRFTPRRRGSHWRLINVRHMAVLRKSGRVKPARSASQSSSAPARTA